MSEYVLKINKGNKNINKLIKTEGYTFNPKNDIVKSFWVVGIIFAMISIAFGVWI